MSAATRKKAPDPVTVFRELQEAAAAGKLPRLTLLLPPTRGEAEPWFAEQILCVAREHARAAEQLDFLDLDGGSPDFEPGSLDAFLAAGSLFGGGRVLLLNRAAKALTRWPRLATALLAAAKDPGGPEWMLVHVDTPAGAKAFGKLKQEAGALRVERFRRLYADPPPWKPDPDASEAARFVAGEAKLRGLRLERGAAGALVQVAGSRPSELTQALEHFELLGEEVITEDRVREVVARGAEGTAFDFAESVLTGDGAGALRVLASFRGRGLRTWDGRRLAPNEAFSLLLSILAKERRRTAQVVEALSGGAAFPDACKAAGVAAGGPPAQRMQKRIERCNEVQLRTVLSGIRRAERQIKIEGRRDTLHAMEELAFACHRSRNKR